MPLGAQAGQLPSGFWQTEVQSHTLRLPGTVPQKLLPAQQTCLSTLSSPSHTQEIRFRPTSGRRGCSPTHSGCRGVYLHLHQKTDNEEGGGLPLRASRECSLKGIYKSMTRQSIAKCGIRRTIGNEVGN